MNRRNLFVLDVFSYGFIEHKGDNKYQDFVWTITSDYEEAPEDAFHYRILSTNTYSLWSDELPDSRLYVS
ncbi:hypothetical protein KSK55_10545 [Methanospirillum purgamenti]|jgi:hypothetical protein|uniref:Uncharacterized protein n=1 Tax=Methanospirillum hungatei TaxID=2203 RepID=A0A8F5VL38_METHU|nr:hypothetical protein [Methanospirillum hungatei]QXO93788.1 hypothetical protein KSK55_10545 [Methanospirillum hungatei]